MIVKKFVGDSFAEAIQKIKEELGSDAMILQTSKIKVGGFFGFFGRWVFEVIAQASEAPAVAEIPVAPPVPVPAPAPAPAPQLALVPPPASLPLQMAPIEMNEIRRELDDLKTKLDLLVTAQLSQRPAPPVAPIAMPGNVLQMPPQAPAAPAPEGAAGLLHDLRHGHAIEVLTPASRAETAALREMMDLLSGTELEPNLRGQIRTHLLENTAAGDLENLRTLKDHVIDYLSRSLVAHKGVEVERGNSQKVIAVVGPTGVGKTTTLAKLGAGLKFNLNLEVGFLTLDTYRVAAADQLRKYGEIIDVPVGVVYRPEDLNDAIKQYSDKDVVLIDTAGRNSKNRTDMQDLKEFLDCGVPVECYLVLSANTKYTDLVEIIDNFKDVNPTNLILTKLDETNSFGSMISLLSRCKKGVSYVTTGQNVPEDIMPASPAKLARLLFERRLVA